MGALNTEQIVQAGIELADEEGLANLSIRKLAERLGAGTMTPYRHVESRDALVELMVDAALGAPPASIGEEVEWRVRTARWADAIVERYTRHPWILDAPVNGGFGTRHRAEWLESLLAALAGTGLPLPDTLNAALLVDGHARATASLARNIAAASEGQPAAYDPAEFPLLTQVFALGSLSDGDAGDGDFGLQRILDGIEAFAAR
jgi:AcrR family transcriptional regulator